jgi:hypothetical protein
VLVITPKDRPNKMTQPRFCIVLTTISNGDVLDSYCKQASAEGVREFLRFIVIPDRKTPGSLYQTCKDLSSLGFDVVCPTLSHQESFLRKIGNLAFLIPYDSDNRRNIGFLMALQDGYDVLISIDDDNYCEQGENIFGTYVVTCQDSVKLTAVHSSTGWFNVCDLLEIEPGYQVYPRGFPYRKRHQEAKLEFTEETGRVRLNAGLWRGDPDLDAITWLAAPVRAKSFKGQPLLLSQDTWSPINTQNTSLHPDLLVAFYFIRMGFPIGGMTIDRYGDIFSGYFCQACVRHLGDRIRVGNPIAVHKRNSHHYLRDLTQELGCVWVLEDLTEWLREVRLQGGCYSETYASLADALDHQVERFQGFVWTDATRGYFHQVAYCMRQWITACKQVV